MNPYITRWGNLAPLQLPSFIVQDGIISLSAAELRVLIVLYYLHLIRFKQRRHDDTVASVKVTQETLAQRTGYSRQATISEAVNSLQEAGFIQIAWDRTGSTKRGAVSSEYLLTVPDTRDPIPVTPKHRNILGQAKLTYFTIPTCLLTNPAHWSLAEMTQTEVRLYVAMLWFANVERSHEFSSTNAKLAKLARLGSATAKEALDRLGRRGLVYVTENESSRMLTVRLCDPFTGEPTQAAYENDEDNPANYYATDPNGFTRRFAWSMNEEQCKQLVLDSVPAGQPVTVLSDGQIMICCPYHSDTKPSCGVSPSKRIFNCLGCGEKGILSTLISKLTGETKGSTIKRLARSMGHTVEFHQPDAKATVRYIYRDHNGNLKKLVLKFVDEDGRKSYSQRQWTQNGWVPGTKGLGPLLYHAELLKRTETVVFVEGEKDADSVTDLHLTGRDGMPVVGVTSGSAQSWDPRLARLLRDKVVIVMPDNDSAGDQYANAVIASLVAQGIKYKRVSFAGTGAKDVSEYLEDHSVEEFVELIDSDWVSVPNESGPLDPATVVEEDEPVEI